MSESNVYGIYKTEGRYGGTEEMLVCPEIFLREAVSSFMAVVPGFLMEQKPVGLHFIFILTVSGWGERQSICLNGVMFFFFVSLPPLSIK